MDFQFQSDIIGVIQLVFSAITLPAVLNRKTEIPRVTSGVTCAGLYVIAGVFLSMGPLWFSFVGEMVAATMWMLLLIFRPLRNGSGSP